jgi:predicted ATPase
MQQWRMLALEPSAMRAPDSINDSASIAANGAHLASALYRMSISDSQDVYASVASNASALTDVRDVRVDFDSSRDLLTLEAKLGDGPYLPARALSDGTLRFLALSVIEVDPRFGGLICMEEPENGIHPAKIQSMVDLLRQLAVDAHEAPGDDNPLRQVIVNTHSPRFVAYQRAEDLLLALPTSTLVGEREISTITVLPMSGTWRGSKRGTAGSKALIADYLTKPPHALMELDYPDREFELD